MMRKAPNTVLRMMLISCIIQRLGVVVMASNIKKGPNDYLSRGERIANFINRHGRKLPPAIRVGVPSAGSAPSSRGEERERPRRSKDDTPRSPISPLSTFSFQTNSQTTQIPTASDEQRTEIPQSARPRQPTRGRPSRRRTSKQSKRKSSKVSSEDRVLYGSDASESEVFTPRSYSRTGVSQPPSARRVRQGSCKTGRSSSVKTFWNDQDDPEEEEEEDEEEEESEAEYFIKNLLKYEAEIYLAFNYLPVTIKHEDIAFLGFYSFTKNKKRKMCENTWAISRVRFDINTENKSDLRREPQGEWSEDQVKDLLLKYLWFSPEQNDEPTCVLVDWDSETNEFTAEGCVPEDWYNDDEDRIKFIKEKILYYDTFALEIPNTSHRCKFWSFHYIKSERMWYVHKIHHDETRKKDARSISDGQRVGTSDQVMAFLLSCLSFKYGHVQDKKVCYYVEWDARLRWYKRWLLDAQGEWMDGSDRGVLIRPMFD